MILETISFGLLFGSFCFLGGMVFKSLFKIEKYSDNDEKNMRKNICMTSNKYIK